MTPSTLCATFIKGFEKCRLTAFLPTKNDKPTIGWGATDGIALGMTWTQQQADDRFASDLAHFAAGVEHELVGAATTQAQFDAMVSLAYNIGLANFHGSTVLHMHRDANYDGAAAHFVDWNKQRNKATGKLEVLDGLTTRRKAEARIYKGLPPQ